MSAASLFSPLKLWANPIFRRYLRARLRLTGLSVGIILTLMVSGFFFFGIRVIASVQGNMSQVDAERTPLIPLMALQALILFFLGTGQVAGGMTAEADEGVIDYQRLTPLSPLAKVFGYLFGLPIREYIMAACTLPFTAWALWRGQVPAGAWMAVYAVFLSSAVLYHLTGLVAGTVVKNRRWAFLVSIGVVFALYTVIPQAAKFGLTTFKYLTVWPVFEENILHLLPRAASGAVRLAQKMSPEVRFFGLSFSETVFTLFSQSGLILTFVVMLWRRWRQPEAHLLGKLWAVGLMAWTQIMLLGNALPLIVPGLIFPSREFQRRLYQSAGWRPTVSEGVAMIGLYGLVALGLMLVLILIITPTLDGQARGWHRARKLGITRPPWHSDAATALWFVLALALTGTAGWSVFAHELIGSHWFAGVALPAWTPAVFALVLLTAGVAFHALLEHWGGRAVFLAVVFAGAAPAMAGAVLAAASNWGDGWLTLAMWVSGISPLSAPIFATQTLLPKTDLSLAAARSIPLAFWFWQSLLLLAAAALARLLWLGRKKARFRSLTAAAAAVISSAQNSDDLPLLPPGKTPAADPSGNP